MTDGIDRANEERCTSESAVRKAEEIEAEVEKINRLTRHEMCRLHRFSPPGHRYFVRDSPLNEAFQKRFAELGGFSVEISKNIGWEG